MELLKRDDAGFAAIVAHFRIDWRNIFPRPVLLQSG